MKIGELIEKLSQFQETHPEAIVETDYNGLSGLITDIQISKENSLLLIVKGEYQTTEE